MQFGHPSLPRDRRIVAAIPNQQATVRNLTLPLMSTRDVFRAARYHFLSVLPLPLEETIVQVSGIRPTAVDELEVTIVAVRRSQVEELVTAIRLAELEPMIVEIRSLAACRVLDVDELPQVLVDIGRQAIHLSFFENGHLRFTRTLFPEESRETASQTQVSGGDHVSNYEIRAEINTSWNTGLVNVVTT